MAWSDSRNPRAHRLPPDWQTRRARVLRRDKHTCQINGPRCTTHATEVDHIRRGDDHDEANLMSACKTCHRDKTKGESATARASASKLRAQRRLRPVEKHPGLID